jgi:hypothetical protein
MTYPNFNVGETLRAADMNAVGLWLVKSQAVGSGVSSVTVTGAFSADYENYKIIYSGGVGSALHNMKLQLGSATTSYFGGGVYTTFSGVGPLAIGDNNAANFGYVGGGDSSGATISAELRSPFASSATYISAVIDTGTSFGVYSGRYFPTTSFTSFVFFPDGAATLTGGTVFVYGYKK